MQGTGSSTIFYSRVTIYLCHESDQERGGEGSGPSRVRLTLAIWVLPELHIVRVLVPPKDFIQNLAYVLHVSTVSGGATQIYAAQEKRNLR